MICFDVSQDRTMPFLSPLRPAHCVMILLIASLSGYAATPSANEAARFLEQATFGPDPSLIEHVRAVGFSGFLDEQFALPASSYPNLPLQPTKVAADCTGTCVRDNYSMYPVQVTFFQNA